MGRIIVAIVFGLCFVVFFIIKSASTGAKKAYKAVFDPKEEKEERKE